jgi:hypothetical protein
MVIDANFCAIWHANRSSAELSAAVRVGEA